MKSAKITKAEAAGFAALGQKWCAACSSAKTFASFNISRGAKDGRQATCRDCMQLYRSRRKGVVAQ